MTLLDFIFDDTFDDVPVGLLVEEGAPVFGVDSTGVTLGELGELSLDGVRDVSASEPDIELDSDEPIGSSFARCADGNGTLTHLFFSDDEFDIARAKAICGKCGLAESCLSGALDRAEPYGVWGGQLLVEGVVVAVKRGRGRPPKTPRPVLVVDEVPIPPHLVA